MEVKKMKKIYMIPLFAVLLVGLVSGFILYDGGYLLDRNEMSEVTNQQIQNYMENTFGIVDHKLMENRIIVYYNITYVEPTSYFNNETNETETRYKVFTQPKPFIIEKELWNTCLNETTQQNCVNILVNNPEPFIWVIDEETNLTIKSTFLQAYEEQERQYYRAKEIRDNAIDNDLDYLFEQIE